jgi:serine/threonine protein phosphatase PrpC
VPKEGNSPEESEDAFSCAEAQGFVAVADGATESSFADLWAQSLVNKFTHTPPEGSPPSGPRMQEWLVPLQKEWNASIAWDRLPWFAEEKARNGAFATLLGLKFEIPDPQAKPSAFEKFFGLFGRGKSDGPRWRALAFGDSNLFHIRDNTLVRSFPLQKSDEFNSRPMLLSSNPARNNNIWGDLKATEGDYQPRDVFILATDAIAKWFLERHEAGTRPWSTLMAIKDDSEYADFVSKLRKQSVMRNDDTTVVLFRWNPSKPTQ